MSLSLRRYKESFDEIKKAFLEHYGTARNKAISRFNVQNELMLLIQRDGQSIAEYVREVESLSDRVPNDMNNMLGMVFVRGLADQETHRRISYDLRDKPEFTFKTALDMVKSWYQEIGAPDPFRPDSVGLNSYRETFTPPVYGKHLSGTVQTAREGQEGTGGIVAVEGTGLPSQEVFNRMMLNFMETMKQDFRISPHRTPCVNSKASGAAIDQATTKSGEARSGRSTANVICFNCGESGHFSPGCVNPPLTYAEQKRIRDQFRVDRDARQQDTAGVGTAAGEKVPSQPQRAVVSVASQQVSTAQSVNASGEPGLRITERVGEEGIVKASPISCIKVVSVAADKKIVGQACDTLMRMPAVTAIFETAMVDKRVRVEEDEDYEQPARSAKQPRTQGPATRSGNGGSGKSMAPLQILTDTSPEPDSESEEDVPIVLERPRARPETVYVAPRTGGSQSQPINLPVAKQVGTKKFAQQLRPGAPINWMRGQKQYSLQDALVDVTPKTSFPQLFDVSPRLRRELADLLRSSVPRERKKGKSTVRPSNVTRAKNTPVILTEAHDDDEVSCGYIVAWIGKQMVGDVLIDGGAMLDLIAQETAESRALEKHTVRGLGMRLADNSLVRLDYYVWADVIVAGVVARIKAYIVPVSVTYKILLSRRRLKRVRGIEYHESNILYIEGIDQVKRKVRGKPAAKQEIEVVRLPEEYGETTELENEEAEDAIELLLHELDHWDEGEGDGEEEAGNG